MIIALIPAAGSGSRVGGPAPKQYRLLGARPLISYALEAFAALASIDQIFVVLAPSDCQFEQVMLSERAQAVTRVLPVGGATRHESVLNGLDALADRLGDDDWVLVHDAARPGITPALITRLIEAVRHDDVGGLLALPVADTLKRAQASNATRVAVTVERAGLWQAQTPQMFRFDLLRRALRAALVAGHATTDEASALESYGYAPQLVAGSLRNFKVTYPEDLELATQILQEERV